MCCVRGGEGCRACVHSAPCVSAAHVRAGVLRRFSILASTLPRTLTPPPKTRTTTNNNNNERRRYVVCRQTHKQHHQRKKQMFYDDLPVWGFIGKIEKILTQHGTSADYRYFLFTHFHFDMSYNAERVIEINVSRCAAAAVRWRDRGRLTRAPSASSYMCGAASQTARDIDIKMRLPRPSPRQFNSPRARRCALTHSHIHAPHTSRAPQRPPAHGRHHQRHVAGGHVLVLGQVEAVDGAV